MNGNIEGITVLQTHAVHPATTTFEWTLLMAFQTHTLTKLVHSHGSSTGLPRTKQDEDCNSLVTTEVRLQRDGLLS